jgi:hypothetical protein
MWKVYTHAGDRHTVTVVAQDGTESETVVQDEPFYTVEDREAGMFVPEMHLGRNNETSGGKHHFYDLASAQRAAIKNNNIYSNLEQVTG